LDKAIRGNPIFLVSVLERANLTKKISRLFEGSVEEGFPAEKDFKLAEKKF